MSLSLDLIRAITGVTMIMLGIISALLLAPRWRDRQHRIGRYQPSAAFGRAIGAVQFLAGALLVAVHVPFLV